MSCSENFVINQEKTLFFRKHLLYFHYVIKELVHAFSCAYIELWMHLGSLESTQEARVARFEQLLRFSRALQTSQVRPCITRYTHAKHEPILKFSMVKVHMK